MAEETLPNDDAKKEIEIPPEPSVENTPDKDSVQKLIQEALAPMKENLDSAYAARDEALRKAAELEEKEKQREIERLQAEGKHKEAFEKQLAEERAQREAAQKRAVELTRDVDLRSALGGFEFRNKNAQDMAFKEIVGELIQNESGAWVHKSGVSIDDYSKTFMQSEDNAFLLKQKVSTGTGSGQKTHSSDVNSGKSLFDLPQSEVLKLAAEGKLPTQKQ